MFEYKKNIYVIGISEENYRTMTELTPKNIELAYSISIDEDKLKNADYVIAQLSINDIEKLLFEMNGSGKSLNNLILCINNEDSEVLFEKDYVADIYDIWQSDFKKNEITYRHKKLLFKIRQDNNFYEYREILDTIINSSLDLIWVKDIKGSHKMFNKNFLDALPPTKEGKKKTYEECVNRGHLFLWELSPKDYADGEFICMESEVDVITANKTLTFDEILKTGDGEMRNLITNKSPLHDNSGNIIGTVGVAKDITNELLYKQMLEKNANTDSLTDLFNRRYMYDLMETNLNEDFSILFTDLDNFKYINDTFGHNKGDEALVLTADTLTQLLPDSIVGRLGGDEFLIFKKGECDLEKLSKTIKNKLKEVYSKDPALDKLGISIGYSKNNLQNPNIEHLIHVADDNMYNDKVLNKKTI